MNTKEEFIDGFKIKLDQLNIAIDKLEKKAKTAAKDDKSGYYQKILKLNNKKTEINENFQKLLQSSEKTWEVIKEGADDILKIFIDSVDKTLSHF